MAKAENTTYKEYLRTTIQEIYPKYAQEDLLKNLEKEHIVRIKKSKKAVAEGIAVLDLSDVEEDEEKISKVLEDERVMRHIENSEFKKSYKYATISTLINFDDQMISDLKDEGKIQDFKGDDYSHDILFDDVHTLVPIKPTVFTIGNVILLKFGRLLTGYSGGQIKKIKYPILAIIYKHLGILEIRLDMVRKYLQDDDDYFYHKHINLVKDWICENFDCEIEEINLPGIIEYIRNKDQDEVKIQAQAMALKSGGKAVLESGENDNHLLPLLGELKELIKANEELFNKSPSIKTLIENFIIQTEETADLPWISLRWKGETNTKGTTVKFKHNYMGQGYTLLQYYGHYAEMERMSSVTDYIVTNKRELDEKEAAEELED